MSLHMLHLPVRARQLMLCAREHRLVEDGWSADQGYLVHSLLTRLFGAAAPKPFDVQDGKDGLLDVLAYAANEIGVLVGARSDGDASATAAVAWDRAGSKPVPAFGAGQRLAFRVRTCPVVRVGKHHPELRHGAEVDPYVAEVRRDPEAGGWDPARRVAIYQAWLAARLAPAATLEGVRLTAMRDARLWRRGVPRPEDTMHDRARRDRLRNGRAPIGRRDTVFEGTLVVADPAAFALLLARGVGRHRAFGFGMLLLRPPR